MPGISITAALSVQTGKLATAARFLETADA